MLTALLFIALTAGPPAAPASVAVPPGASLVLRAEGRGVQIYVCAAPPDRPQDYDWRFVAPQANLFTAEGEKIGRHYAGPTWEAQDGGKVVGEVRAKAPSPDPNAIDWLLLSSKSANRVGVLGTAAFVQRLNTTGGRAPDGGCSGQNVGDEIRIPYTAEYDFYTTH
jgi:hypothetical protein